MSSLVRSFSDSAFAPSCLIFVDDSSLGSLIDFLGCGYEGSGCSGLITCFGGDFHLFDDRFKFGLNAFVDGLASGGSFNVFFGCFEVSHFCNLFSVSLEMMAEGWREVNPLGALVLSLVRT